MKNKNISEEALLEHARKSRELQVSGNVVSILTDQLSRRDSATADGLVKYHGYRVIKKVDAN